MVEVLSVNAIAGSGLEGDRYALARGSYSTSSRPTIRHVSLIAIEAITEANRKAQDLFLPWETRRNLLTEGINLNDLVGKLFLVGIVKMRGVELCSPCARPSALAKKPHFKTLFAGRGGLRAEILESGEIHAGDAVMVIG